VALVGPEVEENLSLRYLAASLAEAGLHSAIVPFDAPEHLPRVVEELLRLDPAIVGLSLAFQRRAEDFLALALALRQAGFAGHVTAGGHFATFASAELLTDFAELDSVIRGEGEQALVALSRAVLEGEPVAGIRGVACRTGDDLELAPVAAPTDVASLPWPDRRGDPVRCLGHGIAPLVASRGCYARCSFCCIAAWHALSEGPRRRLRPVSDLADEMAWLHRERGVDVFVFHDDDFFGPRPMEDVERLTALADGLETRGVGRIATVVKARPVDVTPEVFGLMRDRLGCVRAYVGVESASEQGLQTLRRGIRREQNEAALTLLRELEIGACTNLLIFDPDVEPEGLRQNIAFFEGHAELPLNFARVELYAGTPLLERMQREGRASGDWLSWNYRIADPRIQLAHELAVTAFHPRNFGADAVANHISGTRFDVEIARRFWPDSPWRRWRRRAEELCRRLALDTARGLRAVLDFVEAGEGRPERRAGRAFVAGLAADLRAVEAEVLAGADKLTREVTDTIGQGRALTDRRGGGGPA